MEKKAEVEEMKEEKEEEGEGNYHSPCSSSISASRSSASLCS